jgi:hypothetical protein
MFCKYGKDDPDLRPCLADGKPATFHRWVEEDKALLQTDVLVRREDMLRICRLFQEEGVVSAESHIEKLRTCFALVEYPDGSVGRVKPELIQFLDRKEG